MKSAKLIYNKNVQFTVIVLISLNYMFYRFSLYLSFHWLRCEESSFGYNYSLFSVIWYTSC